MKYYDLLIHSRLPINWTVITQGWHGISGYGRLLDLSDIQSYAHKILEDKKQNGPEIISLILLDDESLTQLDDILNKLSSSIPREQAKAQRIWQIVLLKDLIDNHLPNDPLYCLIALTEFWANFDYPADSPHQIQGICNSQSPEQYYTKSNSDEILKRHYEWLDREQYILLNSSL